MQRAIVAAFLISVAGCMAFGQAADTRPRFVAADVHPVPGILAMRTVPIHGGRYELRNATMLDLVGAAYGFDQDKVFGGPSWLELDRFEIAAKLPGATSPDDQKLMLQSLLEDRFQLVVHKDTKPMPGFALTAGKSPRLKPATGSEESGCLMQAPSGPAPAGPGRLIVTTDANGRSVTIPLGPGATLTYVCRNIAMQAFAQRLPVGTRRLIDETGLKGAWNFEFTWSVDAITPADGGVEGYSMAEALEKQLGLQLEARPVPTPILVVDSVNRTPTPNPPGLAQLMPPIPPPTGFDVASLKPTDPSSKATRFQVLPEGRFTVQGYNLSTLIMDAFLDPATRRTPPIVGEPPWANSRPFDIVAKTPPDTAPLDVYSLALPLRALLTERFKMAYHTEQRPAAAYDLQASKPKLKPADSAGRTLCKSGAAPAGSPGGRNMISCQNITMAQFADWLNANRVWALTDPVTDATGLDGAWDFSITYATGQMAAPRPT